MTSQPIIYHIIVAAGTGSRFGSAIPKQFCQLLGRPVLMETIDRIRRYGHHGKIIVVLHPDWIEPWKEMCESAAFSSPQIVKGGATRWESVRNAISIIPPEADIITVHDGARPVIPGHVIESVIEEVAKGANGAIPAIDVTDSLRMIDSDGENHAVDRTLFKAVQTPQAFNAKMLCKAYLLPYSSTFTDDASVMETAFPDCHLILTPGSTQNIKITHLPDLERAAAFIAEGQQKK